MEGIKEMTNIVEKQYVLFDLDGTLTDSGLGITKSVQYALKHFGIEVEDLHVLEVFVGPPLKDSFMQYYSFSDQNAELAVEKYREYYEVTGLYENRIYNGIKELLEQLKSAGKTLVVATSKPEFFTEKILKYFEIDQYFAKIAGAKLNGERTNKLEVIQYAIKIAGIEDVSQAIMIGDRKFDMEAAKKLGMDTIGVLFGFGDREELLNAGADVLVEKPEEIGRLLIKEY